MQFTGSSTQRLPSGHCIKPHPGGSLGIGGWQRAPIGESAHSNMGGQLMRSHVSGARRRTQRAPPADVSTHCMSGAHVMLAHVLASTTPFARHCGRPSNSSHV